MHNIQAKTILSPHNGMNIYRGCTHGCIYCDARSTCYQMDHAFEDVAVKANAPELLEKALRSKRKKCMISTGAMSDPYLPMEKELGLTRKCLEIIHKHGFGLDIQTKSDLIIRDINLLSAINQHAKCVVQMTLTTYDDALCWIVEPNVCTTSRRVEVLRAMNDADIPTVCWMSPILPFINDNEQNIRGIVRLCADSGVRGIITFGIGLTLRDGDRQYFYKNLDRHFPGLKNRYIQTFGNAYEVPSPQQDYLMNVFSCECEKYGIEHNSDKIFEYLYTFEDKTAGEQLSMF